MASEMDKIHAVKREPKPPIIDGLSFDRKILHILFSTQELAYYKNSLSRKSAGPIKDGVNQLLESFTKDLVMEGDRHPEHQEDIKRFTTRVTTALRAPENIEDAITQADRYFRPSRDPWAKLSNLSLEAEVLGFIILEDDDEVLSRLDEALAQFVPRGGDQLIESSTLFMMLYNHLALGEPLRAPTEI